MVSQRFALPGGSQQISLVLPLMLAALGLGVMSGRLVWDRSRLVLGSAAALTLVSLTAVAIARGLPVSTLSLGLLLALYAGALVVPSRQVRAAVPAALGFFATLMTVLAGIGTALFGLQYAGLGYRDWFAETVPAAFVQQGFVTAYPIFYGSDIFRSNGVLFLEASFYSLFLGIALLVNLQQRRSLLAASVLACGMVTSLSGNGLVVLLPGLVVLALRREERARLARFVGPLVLAVLLASATPLGTAFLERTTEVQRANSSTSLRLVQPYTQLVPPATVDTQTLLLGHGPGSSDLYYQRTLTQEQQFGLLTPIFPKMLYEYGAVGLLVFSLFLLQVFVAGQGRLAPWVPGVALSYFLVNAALLQPTLAFLALLFLGMFQRTGRDDPGPSVLRDVRSA